MTTAPRFLLAVSAVFALAACAEAPSAPAVSDRPAFDHSTDGSYCPEKTINRGAMSATVSGTHEDVTTETAIYDLNTNNMVCKYTASFKAGKQTNDVTEYGDDVKP